jgi:hypothetical protein
MKLVVSMFRVEVPLKLLISVYQAASSDYFNPEELNSRFL